MAGFFIDLAVIDPRDSDRYLVGIECDGAAYHSSRYARDRDRLRQTILENRGWRIHRIWSSDWFYRRDREIDKLRTSIEAALAGRGHPESSRAYEPDPTATDDGGGVSEESSAWEADDEPADVPAPANSSRKRRLKPYEFATFRVGSTPVKPQALSPGQLAHWVTKIVEAEQPIHTEEIGRRLASCCGWQRAGRVIQDCASQGLAVARRSGEIMAEGEFWFMSNDEDVEARDRSSLDPAEYVRKVELISPVELAVAAIHALEESMALSLDELVVETARLLGFARVGRDIDAAVRQAVDTELDEMVEKDHLGRVRLRQDT